MRLFPALFAAALLGGCTYVSFSRNVSDEELILRDGIRSYYDEVGAAFAAGNADMLAGLYDSAIARPMTQDKILAWGKDFFAKHGPASFKLVKLDYEQVGHVTSVVTITYRVETRDGAGSFGGTERDQLVQRTGRHWFITAWDKL
ncbi:MAG: hypothetical protein ACHQ49_18115 [Elusimicrobiota bacterium]